jgi:hypothetical protein
MKKTLLIAMLIFRIVLSPIFFALGIPVGVLVFGLGGCLGIFVAIGCFLRPVSLNFTSEEKKKEIGDALMMFVMPVIIPFAFATQWIMYGKIETE